MTAVSVVIPTYGRESVLLDAIDGLGACDPPPSEILVVDQTEHHQAATTAGLDAREARGAIRRIRLAKPSIPEAMNRGLREARGPVVLFVDDDIVPCRGLVGAHAEAHRSTAGTGPVIVVGQVLQPWHAAPVPCRGTDFGFHSSIPQETEEFVGANFSLRRDAAMALGGFDENFVRAAYRFEAEFAHRFRGAGGRIRFDPAASIRHLRAAGGGTRSYGDHLRTARAGHSVGAYYCLFRTVGPGRWILPAFRRAFGAVRTRHHARRPWWIPITFVAEAAGFFWACALHLKGARLLRPGGDAA